MYEENGVPFKPSKKEKAQIEFHLGLMIRDIKLYGLFSHFVLDVLNRNDIPLTQSIKIAKIN